MIKLNFPDYEFHIIEKDRKLLIFDPARKKYVALTPEEWVRQHAVRYLSEEKRVPLSLMQVEAWMKLFKTRKRADILVCDRYGKPLLIVECKAPSIALNQDALDQAVRYHMALNTRYLMLTNGLQHFFCRLESGKMSIIEELPAYQDLS